VKPPCVWYETLDGWYETECGHAFIVDHGTPAENGMGFCCYCGATLTAVRAQSHNDDDQEEV